ncbi:MAG: Penicillin amidase [Planctomycetaceae bacterium]|nr:Penicillin amidase [Planctomycetaceae bacterium]
MKSAAPSLLLLMFGLILGAASTISRAAEKPTEPPALQSKSVTIQRDEWGVAHVHGKTHADAFFGMGYAQAEDYFWQLEETCIQSLGRYAEVTGETGISGDILNRSFEIVRRSQADFQQLKPEHQAMATAYTDGINRYLATHPETKPRLVVQFEPWHVLAMDRHMLLDFLYRRSHVARPRDRRADEIAQLKKGGVPPAGVSDSLDLAPQPLSGFAADVESAIGSNAWAISGSRTASGSAMLFINPHQPWYGMGQFHEAHLRSDEGLNFTGASFFGNPFPTIGHNEFLGWTYTVNNPDISDTWRVTFDDRARPLHYRFDGGYREAVQWSETLKVKHDGTWIERQITFRKTHQGPIMGRGTDGTLLAVQVAGLFDLNRATQAWGMVLARNYNEWRAAISHCAIPMFNVVYADRAGNIFYAYNGAIPVRDPAFNWSQPVDGSDARTDWKGMHTFDQLPQVFNPKSGYVQSCNSSPYTTTDSVADNPRRDRFPSYMLEDHDVDMRRAKMSRLLLGKVTGLTLDQLQKLAYDTTLYWPLTEIPKLREDFAQLQKTNPPLAAEVAPYFAHLQDWDCKSSLDSTQTTLCLAWYEELYGFGYPAETLKPEYAADRLSWFSALATAGKKLSGLYGDWKYPWGKAHRLQRVPDQPDVQQAGVRLSGLDRSLPMAGAPGPLGIIHTVYSTPEILIIRPQRFAVVGASYMSVVEFAASVRSLSVMPFGASGRRRSPHFFDQAQLYATNQFKSAWFSLEEVTNHAKSTIVLSR